MEKRSSLGNCSRRRFLIQTPVAAVGLMACMQGKAEASTLLTGNYRSKIDPEVCICCGACAEVCPTNAIHQIGDVYSIDPNLCFGCGACVDECPVEAIGEGTLIIVPTVDTEACVACEACVGECPTGALTFNNVPVINPSLCSGCRYCVASCPVDAFS